MRLIWDVLFREDCNLTRLRVYFCPINILLKLICLNVKLTPETECGSLCIKYK